MFRQLDPERVRAFGLKLAQHPRRRVGRDALWKAFASAFPTRPQHPEESRWLVEALRQLEAQGILKLPSERGSRWDRSLAVAVPKAVDLRGGPARTRDASWKSFPWHPRLAWVADLRHLPPGAEAFLRRVHECLVQGSFAQAAPFKYRSLQLTGDEKRLALLSKSVLFAPGRLDLDLLGCLREVAPLAIDRIGASPKLILFENEGPFWVAREVLRRHSDRPYGLVGHGAGGQLPASLPYLLTLEPRLESIDYVGDLDIPGLEIAVRAVAASQRLGLPPLTAAPGVHAAMLASAAAFGRPGGWPARHRRVLDPALLAFLPEDVREFVANVLKGSRRIPEEVLGPKELDLLWTGNA